MAIELTNEEKTSIVNSHLKNLVYNKYNLTISVIEENAKTSPNADTLSSLNSQISEIDDQMAALQAELASLTA
jgi:hypothetical protein